MTQKNSSFTLTAQAKKERIHELIELMDEGNLSAIRVDDGVVKIELERSGSMFSATALPLMAERVEQLLSRRNDLSGVTSGAQSMPLASGVAPTTAPFAATTNNEDETLVRSPMVGTFYVSPSPDEEPFVKVGQEVLTGQTLAIVEAMKMMNEISAPVPGVISEVLAANGAQVEYDQPLFRISTQATA